MNYFEHVIKSDDGTLKGSSTDMVDLGGMNSEI